VIKLKDECLSRKEHEKGSCALRREVFVAGRSAIAKARDRAKVTARSPQDDSVLPR